MYAGVIGSGVGKRLHIPALNNFEDIIVRTVHLPRLGPEQFWSPAQLNRYLPLDLAVVATPPYVHLSYVRALIDHCKIILCEKPVGVTEAELSHFLETMEYSSRVLVNYQLRFHDITLQLRDLIGEQTSKIHIIYRSDAGFNDGPAWYRNEDLGGGPLVAVGSHLIDMIHFFGLKYSSLKALVGTLDSGRLVICGVAQTGLPVIVEIDVMAESAEFTVGVFSTNSTVVGDFIGNRTQSRRVEYPLRDTRSGHRTLSSSAPNAPWRRGQNRLYLSMLSRGSANEIPIQRAETARLVDALAVHKVISAARRSLLNSSQEFTVSYTL